jgi:hypothetical protein
MVKSDIPCLTLVADHTGGFLALLVEAHLTQLGGELEA